MKYGYSKQVKLPFDGVVENSRKALANEGFGVLTEINVKETMKKKLNLDYENYIILGACNPPFADKALQIDKEIGLLLPCNVIVYEENGDVTVSGIIPSVGMSMVENPALADIAQEVEKKLKKAIDSI